MDTTRYIALSSQIVLQRQMTQIANNLANVGTTSYRAEHSRFEQMLTRQPGAPGVAFVQDAAPVRDLAPGPIMPTGNAFDLAIDGPGYLTVGTPDGPRFTRAGSLTLDAQGQLVDARGNPLLDDGGSPIVLAADDGQVTVAGDGTVSVRSGPVAHIGLVGFADERQLERQGDGLYRSPVESPQPDAGGRLVQAALEGSNVQPILEMTTMLATVRAFEGSQKLLDTQHELDRSTIERTIHAGG